MSIAMMTAVWERSKLEGGALLLELAIADHANDDGLAFPSIERLARKARLGKRQTYRLVRELVESGEISIEHGGGRHRSNLYRINLAAFSGGDAETQPPEQPLKKASRRKARKRNLETPWPDDFTLTPDMRKYAIEHGCENPDRAFEAFRYQCLAKGYTNKNWEAVWNRWGYRIDVDGHKGTASRPAPPLTARQAAEQSDARARKES